MGLLLIGHPVFQMGKKTSQEAPLCGKTSENHSHLGLVSSILPHSSVRWGLVLKKLHGWCSSPCGHSLNSLPRETLEVFGNPFWLCMSPQFQCSLYSITTAGELPNTRWNFFFFSQKLDCITLVSILEFSHQKPLISGFMRTTRNYPEQFLLSFEILWLLWYLPVFWKLQSLSAIGWG